MGIPASTRAAAAPRPTARARFASGLPLLVLVVLAGCSWSPGWQRPDDPRDLVTDLADDGSLARGLAHPDAAVRRVAARALGRLPAADHVSGMLASANTEADAGVLSEMCFTLGQWRAQEAGAFLVRMAEHRDPGVRAAAVLALGKLGDDSRTPRLVAALGDDDPRVRQAAALGLFRLDGRRYDHERRATPEQLKTRDAALARAALQDPDEGVRWRAAYALSHSRERPGLVTVLGRCARDEATPLARLFALRGLASLDERGRKAALPEARRLLDDGDPRVALEAARVVATLGGFAEAHELTADASPHVRALALDALRLRALDRGEEPVESPPGTAWEGLLVTTARELGRSDDSEVVRREALALLTALAARHADGTSTASWTDDPTSLDPRAQLAAAGRAARETLLRSPDPRDRARLARLVTDDELDDRDLLEVLLDDSNPSVVAAALGSLGNLAPATLQFERERLEAALRHGDPAVRATAAEVAKPLVDDGVAPPWLVTGVARALDELELLPTEERLEMEEARAQLAAALGLPTLDPVPPAEPGRGPLLDRLVAERKAAAGDPAPEVVLETTRGDITLRLDRVGAPRHVESFLELADDGFYDGLDIHRVVPNFVVQGLDPRHDGWGTGGRRVPDEFGPTPYVTGTLGMPHAGSPHTGGCQIFITHVPTPHLDGAYTAFGQVVDGLDVVGRLEIGDVIERVRRVDGPLGGRAGDDLF